MILLEMEIALAQARHRAGRAVMGGRYGTQCTTCGVVRDYHGLGVARDHAFNEPVVETEPKTLAEDDPRAEHMPTIEDGY